MTLSDLEGHFCCLKSFLHPYLGKCLFTYCNLQAFTNVIFRYSSAAVDKISTDKVRRPVLV